MATPTPGKLPAVAATPPVSTPFSQSHLTAFSPHAPRGSVVPSPQQIRKSPANSNTIYGHPTTSSFGAMNFDSPSAAAALGLGDISLEPLGTARGEDDQRAKMTEILEILSVNKGRVSEDGLERLARRLGLPCLWEPGGTNIKNLIFAGSHIALEIRFTNGAIDRVALDILDSNEGVTKYKEKAAQILLKDLQHGPGDSALTKMLDDFADNLERLATLDKLTVMPKLNCHDAVAGIHSSLSRLHDWEIAQLKEQDGAAKDEESLSRIVMCTKSGRSVMHARKRVGLSLEYWQEKRLISKPSGQPKTWAMVIECKNAPNVSFANPAEIPYARVRVSDQWISQSIQKSNPSAEDVMSTGVHNFLLDWLEPDLSLVPATEASKADAIMQGMPLETLGQDKLPDVMFVAKFEPPLVIPNYIADWIYNVIRATASLFPVIAQVTTIDALLVPLSADEHNPGQPSRQVRRQRTVPVVDKNGAKTPRLHKNTLFVQKLDPAYELGELPFSHPRQLVEILPYLRQYAFLATLIEKSFGAKTEHSEATTSKPESQTTNKRDDFAQFMQGPDTEPQEDLKILNLDVTLITESGGTAMPPFRGPRIEIAFPFRNQSAMVGFEIGLNGAVCVLQENVLPRNEDIEMVGTGQKGLKTKDDLAKLLEICEDFNLFAEYVRRQLG